MARLARFVRYPSGASADFVSAGGSPWRLVKEHWAFIAVGSFALAWAIARACLQSVTLDEADSFRLFAAPVDWPAYWYPSSGNHVLNSILERLCTSVFGLSPFTLRLPALTGAAIYVTACYALCRRIGSRNAMRWLLFLCLIFNPFVMDYMVAARGYGLALGFLMAALWAGWESRLALASICIGLSFAANFSFAYIDAALILGFAIEEFRRTRRWRTFALAFGPGALTAFVICGSTVWNWPHGQFTYGASRLIVIWRSVVSSVFGDLNPFLVHPLLGAALQEVGRKLPTLVAVLLTWQILRIVSARPQPGLIVAQAIGLALLYHWLAFRLFAIPLPMERTAIFFVPLGLLLIGIGAELPSNPRFRNASRYASVAILGLCAIYFVGCLRLSYFREWKFDADVKELYGQVADVKTRYGIREVEVDWRYASPLNFYRVYLHDQSLAPFAWTEPHVAGKPAYLLHSPEANDFINQQNLRVIYHGKISDAVIAIRPELQPR